MSISLPTENYRVRFWKDGSEYVFVIDELNIVAFGPDITSAYDALMAEKTRMMERAEKAGIELTPSGGRLSMKGSSAPPVVARAPLWTAAARAAIATVTVLVIVGMLGVGAFWAVSDSVENRGGALRIVRGAIATAAAHAGSLSEEARAEIRDDLQTIVFHLYSLFEESPPAAPADGSGSKQTPLE